MLSEAVERYLDEYYINGGKLDLTYFEEEEKRDITNEEMMEIALFIMENPSITTLNLIIADLTLEVAKALLKTQLKKLLLESSGVSMEVVSALAGSHLEELSLEACDITDEKTEILFSSPSLKKLALMHNPITGKGLKKLVDNTSLRDLSLSYNKINQGYCRYIGMNRSLQILSLNRAHIGDEGLNALSANSSLEEIYLIYGEATTICPLSPSLKKLILYKNRIHNVEELLKHKPLQEVDLEDNPISEEDYARLKKHYPRSAGLTFYGDVSPLLEHTKDELTQDEEPQKKKLKT